MASPVAVFFPELKNIARELKDFRKSTRRKYMKAAFTAAAKVGARKLKEITPRGPTGNLKKSVKVKSTPSYGLAGYATGRSEDAPAFHQGFLEFGTKPRKTTGRFASTFKSKTKGRGGAMTIVVAKRGKFAGMMRTKSPAYPKSFFKSAVIGQKVDLKRMPVGGRLGRPPIQAAFQQSKSEISAALREQASTAYQRAIKDLADKFPPKATT